MPLSGFGIPARRPTSPRMGCGCTTRCRRCRPESSRTGSTTATRERPRAGSPGRTGDSLASWSAGRASPRSCFSPRCLERPRAARVGGLHLGLPGRGLLRFPESDGVHGKRGARYQERCPGSGRPPQRPRVSGSHGAIATTPGKARGVWHRLGMVGACRTKDPGSSQHRASQSRNACHSSPTCHRAHRSSTAAVAPLPPSRARRRCGRAPATSEAGRGSLPVRGAVPRPERGSRPCRRSGQSVPARGGAGGAV
jgi:hypothetical protein